MRRLVPWVLAAALAAGCVQPDLDACDPTAARAVAILQPFEGDTTGLAGQVMFEGQALVAASCGNGVFCHAEVDAPSRLGAFAGWSLDVRPACDARPPAAGCTPEDRERLTAAQGDAFFDRHAVMAQVESGAMPPGAAGEARLDAGPRFARVDGSALPGLESEEGRAILANWLACGAPVVERVEDVPSGARVGDYCGDDVVGDCVYGGPRDVEPPEPTWASIYERVIGPACAGCHGPGETDFRIESQLDLSDADTAYDQIVGVAATGAFCENEGRTHIVAGDADGSLFFEKMATDDTCGERMPLDGPYLPEATLDAIRQWIDDGASR